MDDIPAPNPGLVVLAGAGPGAPDLVVPATTDWLSRADVVVYDRLINRDLLRAARADAELVYVGKSPQAHALDQQRINDLLVKHCRGGKIVVRLKGGDPLVFGRGGEEAQALRDAGLPYRIVPGITAAVAAGAAAGIPLTDRRCASTVTFITGHEDPAREASSVNWGALAGLDTLVFYMGVGNLPEIARRLIEAGRDAGTPAAVVERATRPDQRTVFATLSALPEAAREARVAAPAVIIVGEVAAIGERLAWTERLPLFGNTVIVTRTRTQASKLSRRLAELGARVIEAPAIAIEPPEDFAAADSALGRLDAFDWVAFTSPNGVEAFVGRCAELRLDARSLGNARIAAVGPGTADALRGHFITPDLMPGSYTTEGLGKALAEAGVGGRSVLLPRADIATAALPQMLRQAGAEVTEATVYRTVRPAALPGDAAEALQAGRTHWITFTSSSTVTNFLALAGETDLSDVKLAAIGPVTADTLRAAGLTPTVTADPCTIEALVAAIVAFEQ